MDSIKSAWEKAMERAESLGSASKEELLKLAWVPEGQKLAANFLKGGVDLKQVLEKVKPEARQYVLQGLDEVLVQNIQLPKDDASQERSQKATSGVKLFKKNRAQVDMVLQRINHICDMYRQFRSQQMDKIYDELKAQFELRVQQAVQRQTGVKGEVQINVETLPEFKQELARVLAQYDGQYQQALDEQKRLLLSIP